MAAELDPKTGELVPVPDVLGARLAALTRSTARVHDVPPGRRREGARSVLLSLGGPLAAERDTLAAKLTRGDVWLFAHPDDPRRTERDDQWLAWLADYERLCDALQAAQEGLDP